MPHPIFLISIFSTSFIVLFARLGPYDICLMEIIYIFLDLALIGVRAVPLCTLAAVHPGDAEFKKKFFF